MKTFIANIAGAHTVPKLLWVAKKYKPAYMVCSEAHRAQGFLRSIPNYDVSQLPENGNPANSNIAVLVRNNVTLERIESDRMTKFWKFHRTKSPRVYLKGVLNIPYGFLHRKHFRMRFYALHAPTDGPNGVNSEAWRETGDAVEDWLNRWDSLPSLASGDWNAIIFQLKAYYEGNKFQYWPGLKVDHFVGRGITGKIKRIPPPPGMHGWYMLTFKPKD